ncbi:hypothetical protein E4K64_25510 [Bradyrhizobium frederickii]|uniref:Uncharacterized protein n=1 Tax=Bradyrhizobium frederickii TaxID=2560054 RepID=A0A4Y9NWS6_9BRAD|nr:hypothetical protein [Bradyrhizobium frederickii]TFV71688.1 hypothetical protein E4K64_25510 [Bradyrhizobium frederickii]
MRKGEWPGIATAVGCLLLLALAIVGSKDSFHLKDWQTTIAAIVAFCGAVIAYQGVMARIDYDRSVVSDADLRRKFGIATRLQFAMHVIGMEVALNLSQLRSQPPHFNLTRLEALFTRELEETWENLEHLPSSIVYNVGQARAAFYDIQLFSIIDPKDPAWLPDTDGGAPKIISKIIRAHEHLAELSKVLHKQLSSYGAGLSSEGRNVKLFDR